MSKYDRPCRLKKEARPFFEPKLAERVLTYDTWHDYYHMDENALEEVQEVYITYGAKRYSKYATDGISNDLGGWSNPENDNYRKDGTAGGTFVFSIHFPSMKFMEHDHFSKGRMMAGLMDKIQHAADRYFQDYVNGDLDEFGDKKQGNV